MNHRGQALIFLVILLPLMALLAVFVIDSSNLIREKNHLDSITRNALKTNINKLNNPNLLVIIREDYNINDLPTNNLLINIDNERLTITNKYQVKSIFGYILGKDKYYVSIKLTAYVKNGKIIIEKG